MNKTYHYVAIKEGSFWVVEFGTYCKEEAKEEKLSYETMHKVKIVKTTDNVSAIDIEAKLNKGSK